MGSKGEPKDRVLHEGAPWGAFFSFTLEVLNSTTWGRTEMVKKKEAGSARCFLDLCPQEGSQCAEDGDHEHKGIFLFGLGSILGDFVAAVGPSTDHPQTASVRDQASQVQTDRMKS